MDESLTVGAVGDTVGWLVGGDWVKGDTVGRLVGGDWVKGLDSIEMHCQLKLSIK